MAIPVHTVESANRSPVKRCPAQASKVRCIRENNLAGSVDVIIDIVGS
jgi:hypothetical protein